MPEFAARVVSNPRTSLATFIIALFRSPRIQRVFDHIRAGAIPRDVRFDYWFVDWTTRNNTLKHNLYPPDSWRAMLRRGAPNATRMHDLVVKFAFGMRFFLESTSSRWFFRGTDDTIINFRALGPFMTDLEQRHNPLTEFVFLANCVRLGERMFPQGGSGYFISRRAVEVLAPLSERILRSTVDCEDYDLGWFMLKRMNFSLAE